MSSSGKKSKVTVVVPVYADWDSLRDCIESLKQHVDKKHKVMLVNDCGPDANLLENNIKQAIEGYENFYYYRNPKNLGFVKTCNRAVLELDKTDNDILLLNSDTETTAGFLEEMLEVLHGQENIGSVSPRSNNATICTIPFATFVAKKNTDSKKSYEIFLRYKDKLPRYSLAPTAHGFCMLIRRSLIKKYGFFDEIFGVGYGEEVDFCQRIAEHGWSSAIANRAFVFHLEARSFSAETKAELLPEKSKIIYGRFPQFKPSLTKYIEDILLIESKVMGKDAGGEIPRSMRKSSLIFKRILRRNDKIYKIAKSIRHYDNN